jgi:hypothetical protein
VATPDYKMCLNCWEAVNLEVAYRDTTKIMVDTSGITYYSPRHNGEDEGVKSCNVCGKFSVMWIRTETVGTETKHAWYCISCFQLAFRCAPKVHMDSSNQLEEELGLITVHGLACSTCKWSDSHMVFESDRETCLECMDTMFLKVTKDMMWGDSGKFASTLSLWNALYGAMLNLKHFISCVPTMCIPVCGCLTAPYLFRR